MNITASRSARYTRAAMTNAHDRQNGDKPAQGVAGETILFAGGGTGGHLSPGLAVAEALQSHYPHVRRLFACSTREIDRAMLTHAGERFIPIEAQPLGLRPAQLLRFARGWKRAKSQAQALADRERIGAVLALGGFVAAPVVSAMQKRGRPVILLNLDAVPGKANRLMARHADLVLTACELTHPSPFTEERVPMPLRCSTLAATFGDEAACKTALGLDPYRPTLLITGASQGSQSINDLMQAIVESHADWLDGWQLYHLTGHGRGEGLSAMYVRHGVLAHLDPFQNQMGLAWGAADLALSRAGANSVAEIAANAVPTIFLPYPYHRDQHQVHNARPLVVLGGAVIIEDLIDPALTLARHGEMVRELLRNASRRTAMRAALDSHKPQNGAQVVAERLMSLIAV